MHPVMNAASASGPTGAVAARDPRDPDPVRSTKARAVLALGIVALCTSVTVGGIIPAVLALSMARQCRAEMRRSQGFLTGGALLRAGERLAWAAIVVVATVLVVAAISGLLTLAPGAA